MRMSIACPPDFSQRLRAALAVRRIEQKDFAKTLGVSRTYVTLICANKRKPSLPVALHMERELGDEAWAYCMAQTDVLPPLRGAA
jgi:transcriptional regulator with XRE-family HTH domain